MKQRRMSLTVKLNILIVVIMMIAFTQVLLISNPEDRFRL